MNEPIVLSSTTCYVLYNEFSGYLLGVSTNCLHVSASYTPRVIQYTKREYALDIIYQNPELLNGFEVRTVVEQTVVTVQYRKKHMSVLACCRNGCSNILCDRYSLKYGYICNECANELKQHKQDIYDFMASPKEEEATCTDDWEETVDDIFEAQ